MVVVQRLASALVPINTRTMLRLPMAALEQHTHLSLNE